MQLALELLPHAHARASDPGTSQDAADRIGEFAGHQCRLIHAALESNGPQGAEQIGALVGLQPYAVRKRLADLEHAKLAVPTDETRKTVSGRNERIWKIANSAGGD